MQPLSSDLFAGRVGETFSVSLGETAMDLTLAQVLHRAPVPGSGPNPFTLVFKSASQAVLPQRTYTLRNPALGDVDIFIVAIGRDAKGVDYEAIFN